MSGEKKNPGKILTENTFKIAEAVLNQAQQAYLAEKTPEKYQAVIQAQKQYDDLLSRHEKQSSQKVPEALATLEDVEKWVKNYGRKAGLRTIKNDVKKGLLKKSEGGYLISDVEKYAKTKRIIPIPADVDASIDLRDKKEQAEVRYKEAIAKREEHKLAIQQGKYLPKTDVWIELAARGIAFEDQLLNTFEATAIELKRLAAEEDTEAFIARLSQITREALAEFAKPMSLEIDLSGLEDENADQEDAPEGV